MLITAGERKATALLCMALHDLGVAADSFTGSQAGFITDTNHTNAKILEVRADRVREAVDAGRVPVVGGAQGVSTDRDVTFLGRGGSDTTAVALAARPQGRRVRALHRRHRGVHRRPAGGALRPAAWPASASTRCSRCAPAAARSRRCGRSSSPAPTASPCTFARASPGSRAPGHRGGSRHGTGHRLGGRPRQLRGQGHHLRRARPARASPPALFRAPGRRGRQRRHDRAERVRAAARPTSPSPCPMTISTRRSRSCAALAAEIGAAGVAADAAIGKVSLVGAGHEVEPGRGGHRLRDAGRQRRSTSR